jgi:hypothetical protein
MADPLDAVFAGLAAEKQRIEMTDEMARRVGVDREVARRVLAMENLAAKRAKQPVDMVVVAQAISIIAKKEKPDDSSS